MHPISVLELTINEVVGGSRHWPASEVGAPRSVDPEVRLMSSPAEVGVKSTSRLLMSPSTPRDRAGVPAEPIGVDGFTYGNGEELVRWSRSAGLLENMGGGGGGRWR